MLPFEEVLCLARPAAAMASPAQSGSSRQTFEAQSRPAPRGLPSPVTGTPLGIQFSDVAKASGLNVKTVFGGEHRNKYLLETTGCGIAFFDFDQDDWFDIFVVNGWRLEGSPKGHEPTCHLFKNNRDGTFTDATANSGLARSGWGQGCCVGDYNNDGWNDLFVTYYGQNALFRNNGNGTFTEVTKHLNEAAGLRNKAAEYRRQAAVLSQSAVSRQKAAFALNAGNQLLLRGQIADAIARYQESLADDPTFAEAHVQLAVAYDRQGRTDDAAAERMKAKNIAPPK